MEEARQQFVDKNRERLTRYLEQANDRNVVIPGFGVESPKSAFKALLGDDDVFLLPLCFYFIVTNFQSSDDKNFALQSMKGFYSKDEKGHLTDPIMAYTYAYLLVQAVKDEESNAIIDALADQCFAPALVTAGDQNIMHRNVKHAATFYEYAVDHGHALIMPRLYKIFRKTLPFPKNILAVGALILESIPFFVKLTRRGVRGEEYLYFDFYGTDHFLKKYWKLPKKERIKKALKTP